MSIKVAPLPPLDYATFCPCRRLDVRSGLLVVALKYFQIAVCSPRERKKRPFSEPLGLPLFLRTALPLLLRTVLSLLLLPRHPFFILRFTPYLEAET